MAKRRPTALHPDDPRGSTTPAPKPLTPAALSKRLARFNGALPAMKAALYLRPDFDGRYAVDDLADQAARIATAQQEAYRALKFVHARLVTSELPSPLTEVAAASWLTPALRRVPELSTLVRQMARLASLRARLATYSEATPVAHLQDVADALASVTTSLRPQMLAEQAEHRLNTESQRKNGVELRTLLQAHPRKHGEKTHAYAARLTGEALALPAFQGCTPNAITLRFQRLIRYIEKNTPK
ncbi:hypothetical protein [Luteitalea sp.]